MTRLRRIHLLAQALALVGIAIVLMTAYRDLAAWGMPSQEYSKRFYAHLSDLERGASVPTVEKIDFLKANVPHQLDVESTFLRLVLLVAFIVVAPIGVGAYLHRIFARGADAKGDEATAEGMRMVARVEIALVAIVAGGVMLSLVGGGAKAEAARHATAELSQTEGPEPVLQAFKLARSSNRLMKTWSAVAFSMIACGFLLGIVLNIFAARYLVRIL